jgi:tRNA(fMet)-specific endonuclease VapC
VQHSGRLYVSRIVAAELYAWAHCRSDTVRMLDRIENFLTEMNLIELDVHATREFGRVRGLLRSQGIAVGSFDLLIAATALVNNLTVVTHNTRDFAAIPSLSVIDWLAT